MSEPQDSTTPAIAGTDPSAADVHADHPESATPVDSQAAETTAPVDYESAFHQMHEHAVAQAAEISDLKVAAEKSGEQLAAQTAAIADLNDQLSAMSATLTDFRNDAVVQRQKLDDKTTEASSLSKSLADADAQLAEFRRQRSEYKLWGVRAAGDRSDRMVLAEDGGKAHDKVPGAERIVLAAPTLVW